IGARIPSPAKKIGRPIIIRGPAAPPKSSQPSVALCTWVRESRALRFRTGAENKIVFELRTVIHSRFTVRVTGVSSGRRDAGPEISLTFQDFSFSPLQFACGCRLAWES